MKELNFEQMENIQGGVDWCYVARGVAGCGGGLLACGCTLTLWGGVIYGCICAYAAVC